MARTLSHRIEAIEYIHAKDGQPYRHDFTHDGGEIRLKSDGSISVRNKDKKLWDLFDVNGTVKPFLINPRGRRTTTKRGAKMAKKKRKLSAAQRAAGFGGKRRRKSNPKRAARTVTRYVTRKRNAPKRRRSRRRRNPMGLSVNGLLGRLQQGGMDALAVLAGRAGVRAISKQFPYPSGSVMDSVVELGGALALGMVAERIVGRDRARFVLAGALSNPAEDMIASAKIPYISALLSATPSSNTTIYPPADGNGMSAWQQMQAWQQGGGTLPRLAAVDALPGSTVAYLPA